MIRQAVTHEEAKKIIQATDTELQALYLTLLWYTGGRSGEVRVLKPENIGDGYVVMPNLKQHKTYINAAGEHKAIKHPRASTKQVFIPEHISATVKDYIVKNGIQNGEYLFASITRGGRRIPELAWSKMAAWRVATQAAYKAGIYKVNRYGKIVPAWPHCWRHGNAQHLYNITKDIEFTRQQLGHANLETTKIYMEITEQQKRDYTKII